jgi:succinate dehydrogenase flavin-adding protein (antitoxin of CptAB toxin-antitoxin module)
MKYLYIVDYWVPFPSSEYGGLINLIAESDTEAFEILSQEDQFDDRYVDRIMERIVNSQKFALVDDFESGILEAFTT